MLISYVQTAFKMYVEWYGQITEEGWVSYIGGTSL
jgi:hypothetical protein